MRVITSHERIFAESDSLRVTESERIGFPRASESADIDFPHQQISFF